MAVPSIPSALPVATVRSQSAPFAYGPRSITGTIIGKDGQPTTGDSFTASEQGSGRYRIDIPALAQGTWTMRIQIGAPSETADYAFAVSP